MATSVATAGFGCLLKDGGTTIAEVKGISGVGFNVSFAETTHMESPSAIREFIPTLIEASEITFSLNFLPDDATHDNIRTRLLAKTSRTFSVTFTDTVAADTWSFTGYYSSLQINAAVEGVLEGTASIKIVSGVTIT